MLSAGVSLDAVFYLPYAAFSEYVSLMNNNTMHCKYWSGPLNSWNRLANKDINLLNVILKPKQFGWGDMATVLTEIRSMIRRKSFISIVVLVIIIVTALTYISSTPSTNVSSSQIKSNVDLATGYYHSQENYTIVNYVFNGFGDPVRGYPFTVSLFGSNHTSITDSSGYANISLTLANLTGSILVNESQRFFPSPFNNYPDIEFNLSSRVGASFTRNFDPAEFFNLGSSAYYISGIFDKNNEYLNGLLILSLNPNGSSSRGLVISYAVDNEGSTGTNLSAATGNTTDLPGFTSYVFIPNISPSYWHLGYLYKVTLEDGAKNILFSTTFPLIDPPNSDSYANMLYYFQFFLPLLALSVGFSNYGRDYSTGIIESIISKPITRARLLASRYAASVISILSAIALVLGGILSLTYLRFFEFYSIIPFLSSVQFEYIFIIFGVEILSFTGLAFLSAHLFRSETGILFFIVGSYVIFDILFSSANSVAGYFGNVINFYSPGGFENLFLHYLSSRYARGNIEIPFVPHDYLIYLVVDGILWSIVPILLAAVMAKKWGGRNA